MAINKLFALVTILASIPTSVLSTNSTEDHQIQSIFPSEFFECIDHLKSLLNDLQLSAHLQMLSCVQTGELTVNQCYLSEICTVLFSTYGIEIDWKSQARILNLSLGPYRLRQIPDAGREAHENLWKERATMFGCVF
ncbi:MAG: hypothetical protein MHMPM18_002894 [Marteilia pararefringens]